MARLQSNTRFTNTDPGARSLVPVLLVVIERLRKRRGKQTNNNQHAG